MDPKEQELIKARAEAYRDWDKADSEWIEACHKRDKAVRNCVEAERKAVKTRRKWDEAYHELRNYQDSNAQQGGKISIANID